MMGSDPELLVKRIMSMYDAPAFVRRARRVQEVQDALLHRCRKQLDALSGMARLRVGMLRAMVGNWRWLVPSIVGDDQIAVFEELETRLQPRPSSVDATASVRALRRAVDELIESIQRFNGRWKQFVSALDLSEVNSVRDGYNRYYVLEKECLVHSFELARQGFRPLAVLTTDDVLTLFPVLPAPQRKP